MNETSLLAQEWQVLQQEQAEHERNALFIKLAATGITFISLAVIVDLLLVGVLVVMLWLQEAIIRTTQARLTKRLLKLEMLYLQGGDQSGKDAFQLHTTWLDKRGSFIGLVGEYCCNAIRPTVAIPYVVLMALLIAALSMSSN